MKIPVSHGWLEAHLRPADGPRRAAGVVCHPHPLHGGTMHTKAVFRAAQALTEAGVDALRFNFRGVGLSTGSFDDGIGEQDDARAALDWLEQAVNGAPLVLGGFSFGSRVALTVAASDPRVRAVVALGLAVSLFEYDVVADMDTPILVVQGEEDEFGSGAEVERVMTAMGPHVEVVRVPGADHYFTGRFDPLRAAIRDWFVSGTGADALARPSASAGV